MDNSSARSADGVQAIVHAYGDMLFRICYVLLGNEADAEDAVQETIIKYMQKAPAFADSEHEKAWLITTAKNQCRDMLRFRIRHPQVNLEYLQELLSNESDALGVSGSTPVASDSGIMEALMSLPEKFRLVLILYYVEEYRIGDIARIIKRTPSAVKMRLKKGRRLLEEKYRREYL